MHFDVLPDGGAMLTGEASVGEEEAVLSNGDTNRKKSIRLERHYNRTTKAVRLHFPPNLGLLLVGEDMWYLQTERDNN